MKFSSSPKTFHILVSHSAKSLYSALHEGKYQTWLKGLPHFERFQWTPRDIDTSCFIQGYNVYGPHPWVIRSRVVMVSQPTKCALLYVVRGVGIGVDGNRSLSCGAVTVTKQLSGPVVKTYPSKYCAIYIQ